MQYKGLILLLFFLLTLRAPAQNQPAPKYRNWHLDDKTRDGYFGISWQQAYDLVKDKKAMPVIVAVIDGGTDTTHEALRGSFWINPKVIAGSGKDGDHNGYVGDIHGWDFIGGKNNSTVENDSYEYHRVYYAYKNKFKTPISRIRYHGLDSINFITWKIAAKILLHNVEELEDSLKVFERLIAADSLLRDVLGKNIFTKKDLEEFSAANRAHGDARSLLLKEFDVVNEYGVMNNKGLMDKIISAKSMAVAGLKFENSPPTAYRNSIVRDDYFNLSDQYYGNNNIMGENSMHGTHVAGIIKGLNSERGGVKGGSCAIRLMILRVVPSGDEHDKDVALAIRYAVDNGARVINMSFGKSVSPEKKWVDDAVKYAAQKDILIVHAAGNEAENSDSVAFFPNPFYDNNVATRAPNWIEVGASGDSAFGGLAADFSNYGKNHVDVFAPGRVIYSAVPSPGTYSYMDGTSMAAPVVSGMAAFLLSHYPQLTGLQVKKIIEESVEMPKGPVKKPGTGQPVPFSYLCKTGGIVNLFNSVRYVQQKGVLDSLESDGVMQFANDFSRRMGYIKDTLVSVQNKERQLQLYNELIRLGKQKEDAFKAFIAQYPSSAALPLAIYMSCFDQADKQMAYNGMSDWQKKSEYGLLVEKDLEITGAATGSPAVGFSLPAANGKPFLLQELISERKVILLDIWASWCGPCRGEFPALKILYNKFHSRGLEIVSISIDQHKNAWKKAIADDGTSSWHHVIDSTSAVFRQYGSLGVPRKILIDKEGRIVEWNLLTGLGKQEEKITYLLNQP